MSNRPAAPASLWSRVRKRVTGGARQFADAASLAAARAKANLAAQSCARSGGDTLDLSCSGLAAVPDAVLECSGLVSLDLSGNDIESLPGSLFASLPRLESLDVSRNASLRSLPESLGEARCLQSLRAERCALGSLPPGLTECVQLRELLLGHNRLGALPLGTSTLPRLTLLDIDGNRPLQGFSLPLWLLNECVPRRIAWLCDLLFALSLASLLAAGAATAGSGDFDSDSDGSGNGDNDSIDGALNDSRWLFRALGSLYALLLAYVVMAAAAGVRGGKLGVGHAIVGGNWRESQPRLDAGADWKRPSNWIAAVSIAVESVQLCSLAFTESVPWPKPIGSGMRVPSLAIPESVVSPGVRAAAFFTAVAAAFSGRLLLEMTRMQVRRFSKVILFLALYVFLSVGFIPIITTLVGASLRCTSSPPDQGGDGDLPRCWNGLHSLYIGLSGLAVLVFFPFSALSQPVWQEQAPEALAPRFRPGYLVAVGCLKLVAAVAPAFLTRDSTYGAYASDGSATIDDDDTEGSRLAGAATLFSVTLLLWLLGAVRQPCTESAWGRMRSAGHLCATVTSAVSMWVVKSAVRSYAPVAVVTSAWVVIISATTIYNARVQRKSPASTHAPLGTVA